MAAPGSFRSGSSLTYSLSAIGVASVPATLPVGFIGGGSVARIVNSGPATDADVFVVFGTGAQTAVFPVTGAPPVGQGPGVLAKANATTYYDLPAQADSFAAIALAAGPSTIYVTRGEGNGP